MQTETKSAALEQADRRRPQLPRYLPVGLSDLLAPWAWLLSLPFFVVLAILPWTDVSVTTVRVITVAAIYALVVSGINLTWGYAGEFSLGQAATFALGSYLGANMAIHGTTDFLVGIVVTSVVGAVFGLLVGLPGLRISGLSFAMTTFYLVLLVPSVAGLLTSVTGGFTGLAAIPNLTFFGTPIVGKGYYVVCIATLAAWLLFMRGLVTSEYGRAFTILRHSPVLAESIGISVFRHKLLAYVLGSIPAAVAGLLFAHLDSFIAPASFGFSFAVALIAGSVIGGARSVYGALAGALFLQIGPLISSSFQGYSLIVFGVLLLVGALLTPNGVAGLANSGMRLVRSRLPAATSPSYSGATEPLPGLISPAVNDSGRYEQVSVRGVSKSFGGLAALDDVSLLVKPGTVTALIGPNGSGKTTLLNILSRFYTVDSGEVMIGVERLDGRRPHVARALGVGRTFQTPRIPEGLTVVEAVASGAWSQDSVNLLESVVRSPRARRKHRDHIAAARAALAMLGIEDLADKEAAALPLGQRRLVEVARGVIEAPRLLLLDEPASGLSSDATERLAQVLSRLKTTSTAILLVEHNVEFVSTVADQVYVLAEGRLIAEGSPTEVMRNPDVISSYTGKAPV
ncbi:MAG: amino acid transporter, ATP-binding [Frankiales bacterium]|nr:amino acid transporter, ATP-binding [Frankiales bacterium]